MAFLIAHLVMHNAEHARRTYTRMRFQSFKTTFLKKLSEIYWVFISVVETGCNDISTYYQPLPELVGIFVKKIKRVEHGAFCNIYIRTFFNFILSQETNFDSFTGVLIWMRAASPTSSSYSGRLKMTIITEHKNPVTPQCVNTSCFIIWPF